MNPTPNSAPQFEAEAALLLAIPSDASDSFPAGLPLDLDELERLAVAEALRRTGGNRTRAARLLGVSLRTLRNRLREERQRAASARPARASQEK